jgi:hypothetical protein
MISNFTEDYLKDYEEQIRKLPLDELYEVLDIIRKDDSPERQNIVKARIKEIEGEDDDTEQAAKPNSSLNDAQISTQAHEQSDPENEDTLFDGLTQEEIDNYNNNQQLPDTDGFGSFLLCMAFGFGMAFVALISASISHNRSPGFHDIKLITILPFLKYVPIGSILFFFYITIKDRVQDYWIGHLKLPLCIASYLAVNAATTFISGTYSGIYRCCTGTPAYIIAAGILFFSILLILNTFFPISKKIRPKNGFTLIALALILETALR